MELSMWALHPIWLKEFGNTKIIWWKEGFTKKYQIHLLVWYEIHDSMESAIQREKNIKDWKRSWKLNLIESSNPDWKDLYPFIQ